MLYMEIMYVDFTDHTKYKNTLCGRIAGLFVLNLVLHVLATRISSLMCADGAHVLCFDVLD